MKVVANFNNLIKPLMATLKGAQMTALQLDMFVYSIIRSLSDK